MYAKCGFVRNASSLFDSCSQLDFVSCNIIIAGYGKFGRLGNACRVFDVMTQKGRCFFSVLFLILLDVPEGAKGYVSCTTMIMVLAQTDCWNEAINVFNDMRFEAMIPIR